MDMGVGGWGLTNPIFFNLTRPLKRPFQNLQLSQYYCLGSRNESDEMVIFLDAFKPYFSNHR